jgi:hypothetical protein
MDLTKPALQLHKSYAYKGVLPHGYNPTEQQASPTLGEGSAEHL